jgi:phosphate transport system protein
MTDHLPERVRTDLDAISRRLRRMAELVLKALEDALDAVATRDRKLANSVILVDNRIDSLERHVDRLCQEFLVRHMPVAAQLRYVISAVKVNAELERLGDYAEAIARRAISLGIHGQIPERERIIQMARLAFQMLRQSVQAFLDGDPERATRVFEMDRQIDATNSELWQALAHPGEPIDDLTVRFVVLGVLNRIERVADRACNIAEEAIYAQRGEVVRHVLRHDLRVLFFDDTNATRGQIAEGIARTLAPTRFLFSSAGVEPALALDANVVRLMSRHGIDLSRQRPKTLADAGRIEDFHVVVTLSAQSAAKLPAMPYGGIEFNWDIEDPSKATGSPADIERAYAAVYDDLHTKIEELVESMLGVHPEREEDR